MSTPTKVVSTLETNNFLRHKEAAEFLGISPKTLYKWCWEQKLRYYKAGSLNLFKIGDLDAFIESQAIDPQTINDRAAMSVLNTKNKAA